ncbi:MAG TPA: head GIN domain-containing protein [Phnomibacter sp.]|nr:head GIN domain-containing protein [Phnomibacter sp.]
MQKLQTALLFAGILACTSLQAQWKKITGNGNQVTRDRSLSGFSEVSVAGVMQVIISEAATISVQVQADENLQEYILTEVKGNKLTIKHPNNVSINSKGVKVMIKMPKLDAAGVSGSGSITGQGTMPASGNFTASISGSGNINLKTSAKAVGAHISGSGDIALGGTTSELEVSISGSGSFKGFDLKATDVEVKISGSGSVETTASSKLDAKVSGSGDVFYKGNPSLSLKTSGSGKIKKSDG